MSAGNHFKIGAGHQLRLTTLWALDSMALQKFGFSGDMGAGIVVNQCFRFSRGTAACSATVAKRRHAPAAWANHQLVEGELRNRLIIFPCLDLFRRSSVGKSQAFRIKRRNQGLDGRHGLRSIIGIRDFLAVRRL